MPTDKYKKPRKKIKAKINRFRDADVDTLADLDFEERATKHVHEKNRYEKILEKRKKEKQKIKEKKLEKYYIKNRKHIEKRAKVEAEILNEQEDLKEIPNKY